MALSLRAAQTFLIEEGFDIPDGKVEPSQVPYRNW
jgi:hypothetical protein